MERLHNELNCLGPQGNARMDRETHRGQVHEAVGSPVVAQSEQKGLELALEFSELQRAKRMMAEVRERLDTIKNICVGADNIVVINNLVAGWTWHCDNRLRDLEKLLSPKADSVPLHGHIQL